MDKEIDFINQPLDCACLIHSDGYSWEYVDKIYHMLTRCLSRPVRLHVYTESDRHVPAPYIKHELVDWQVAGPRRSWWYKLQLFNSKYHSGPLLYLDLDVVLISNIDWVWKQNLEYFWAVRDFKYLWKPHSQILNSSLMWWDTSKFDWIWQDLVANDVHKIIGRYRGDQDYLSDILKNKNLRFLDSNKVVSWRWQALDGGYDFTCKKWKNPGIGTNVTNLTSVLVFHGNPKPHEVDDNFIQKYWL